MSESWWYDAKDGVVKDENRLSVAIVTPALTQDPENDERRAARDQAGRMLAAAPELHARLAALASILDERLEADRLDGIGAPARDADALKEARITLHHADSSAERFGWDEGDITIE